MGREDDFKEDVRWRGELLRARKPRTVTLSGLA
jgi:hypothetical protein